MDYENQFIIQKYEKDLEKTWDSFVMETSINGTFLHTRRFLNYHNNKFVDNSYLIWDEKKNLICVCPACIFKDGEKWIFNSHMGSTYGGLVLHPRYYCTRKLICIIEKLEEQIKKEGFSKAILKITPSIFAKESNDLLQYCLYYNGWKEYKELNLYADLLQYGDNILGKFTQGKRTNIHNCIKAGISIRELTTEKEIIQLHDIICETLSKYELTPVHSAKELIEFKFSRLKEESVFFGEFLNDQMIGGAVVFLFKNVFTAHTQYLCAKRAYDKLSPMSFLYYAMIIEMTKRGFEKLSWGIASEHLGKEINLGLTNSKEAFGSRHGINSIFEKDFSCR